MTRALLGRVNVTRAVRRERYWGRSSAGRAPALQAGGHRFEPGRLHQGSPGGVIRLERVPGLNGLIFGPVAQLVRARA